MKRLALLPILAFALSSSARADDPQRFVVAFQNGVASPARLEVPAHQRFILEVQNTGTAAMEFESKELGKEKLVAASGKIVMSFNGLEPGEYPLADDFHPEVKPGLLSVK